MCDKGKRDTGIPGLMFMIAVFFVIQIIYLVVVCQLTLGIREDVEMIKKAVVPSYIEDVVGEDFNSTRARQSGGRDGQ